MTEDRISSLQAAGAVAASVHQEIAQMVEVGVNVLDIEKMADKLIKEAGMKPAFQGYKGYPSVTCISINNEVVHGIPRNYLLKNGDVVKVDLGVNCNGWLVDTARTHLIGTVTPQATQLVAATEQALFAAIAVCRAGTHVGDIGAAVEKVIKAAGFAVVRDLTGHGIGRTLQEPPSIPNYGRIGQGPVLTEGMTIAVEPITSLVETDIAICPDGWTIKSTVPTISAHVEHTILVTEQEAIVLTALAKAS